jgi:hypothetical protein
MKRFYLLMAGLAALVFATPAVAQMPGQLCTTTGASAATLKKCGVEAGTNTMIRVTDAILATGAITGGTDEVVLFCEGATCVIAADDGGMGTFGNCITFSANDDQICNNDADGNITFSRDEAGVVLLTCADDDATAQCTIQSGGVSPMQIGGADTTQMDIQTDSELNLINTSDAEVAIRMRDYGSVTDQDMAHGELITNCTNTATGTEECDVTLRYTKGGTTTDFLDMDASANELTFGALADGGNTGAKNEIVALPKIRMAAIGAMGDGPVLSEPITPTAALCAPVVAGTEADSATIYRDTVTDVTSYQYTFQGTVGAGEGLDCDVTGHAVVGTTSVGFWFRSDTVFDNNDVEVNLLDGAAVEGDGNMPAYTTANVWQWVEVDVTADCAATCADIDGVSILTTADEPTELNGAVFHVDSGAFWLAACEETLGDAILTDGVLAVTAGVTAGGNSTLLAEGTDYIVHYQAGNDAVCMITDQSANYGLVLFAAE